MNNSLNFIIPDDVMKYLDDHFMLTGIRTEFNERGFYFAWHMSSRHYMEEYIFVNSDQGKIRRKNILLTKNRMSDIVPKRGSYPICKDGVGEIFQNATQFTVRVEEYDVRTIIYIYV